MRRGGFILSPATSGGRPGCLEGQPATVCAEPWPAPPRISPPVHLLRSRGPAGQTKIPLRAGGHTHDAWRKGIAAAEFHRHRREAAAVPVGTQPLMEF